MKYVLNNRSNYMIQVNVPAPVGSRRSSASLTLLPSGSLDILPYAGSIQACRNIAFIYDLKCRNLISITEEV
jgi:hypothetical protein